MGVVDKARRQLEAPSRLEEDLVLLASMRLSREEGTMVLYLAVKTAGTPF